MSKNILFISETALKDNSFLSDNVDPKQLLPTMKMVQDQFVHPLLGTALYKKLQDLVASQPVPDGPYKLLLDDYLTDVMVWRVLSELPMPLQYKMLNKGVVTRSGETFQTVSPTDVNTMMDYCRTKAEWYSERVTDYLCENSSLYPEYENPGSGADTIHPDITQYTGGMFLGRTSPDNRTYFGRRYRGDDDPDKYY